MVESGRTCACTPRSLLVPAGGVTTLDPSQRISAKELEAKDREWNRQRQAAAQQSGSKSPLKSLTSEATLQAETTSSESSSKMKKGLLSRSLFGGKGEKSKSSTG